MKQLELFETTKDYNDELQEIRNEMDKLRKSLFARHGDLKKNYNEIAHELMVLKINICRGKIANEALL